MIRDGITEDNLPPEVAEMLRAASARTRAEAEAARPTAEELEHLHRTGCWPESRRPRVEAKRAELLARTRGFRPPSDN